LDKRYFTKLSLSFAGKGCDKYKVNDLLLKNTEDMQKASLALEFATFGFAHDKRKEESSDFYESSEFKKHLNDLYKICVDGSNKSQAILMHHRSRLGADITRFYSTELDYPSDLFTRFVEGMILSCRYENGIRILSEFYLSKINSLKSESISELFAYGLIYPLVQTQNAIFEYYLENRNKTYPFQGVYNKIKKTNTGLLREVLLSTLFLNERFVRYVNDFSKRDSCLTDAFQLIKTDDLRKSLSHELRFQAGKPIFDLSLQDTSGKIVDIKSLKGKVFLLDFYFNGCFACSGFSNRFKTEVNPEFSNNPNFEVVSVNIDKKRKTWIDAIKSGLYNQPGDIHLNTGGYEHPLFKEFDISTFPWVILVDAQGKVLSYKVQNMGSSVIKEMIKGALSKSEKAN